MPYLRYFGEATGQGPRTRGLELGPGLHIYIKLKNTQYFVLLAASTVILNGMLGKGPGARGQGPGARGQGPGARGHGPGMEWHGRKRGNIA